MSAGLARIASAADDAADAARLIPARQDLTLGLPRHFPCTREDSGREVAMLPVPARFPVNQHPRLWGVPLGRSVLLVGSMGLACDFLTGVAEFRQLQFQRDKAGSYQNEHDERRYRFASEHVSALCFEVLRAVFPKLRAGDLLAIGRPDGAAMQQSIAPESWNDPDAEPAPKDWMSDRALLSGGRFCDIYVRPAAPIPYDVAAIALGEISLGNGVLRAFNAGDRTLAEALVVQLRAQLEKKLQRGQVEGVPSGAAAGPSGSPQDAGSGRMILIPDPIIPDHDGGSDERVFKVDLFRQSGPELRVAPNSASTDTTSNEGNTLPKYDIRNGNVPEGMELDSKERDDRLPGFDMYSKAALHVASGLNSELAKNRSIPRLILKNMKLDCKEPRFGVKDVSRNSGLRFISDASVDKIAHWIKTCPASHVDAWIEYARRSNKRT